MQESGTCAVRTLVCCNRWNGRIRAQFQRTVLLNGLAGINLKGKTSEADPDVEHALELCCLQWSLHCRLMLPPS